MIKKMVINNKVILAFDDKPNDSTREYLKMYKFRWDPKNRYWSARLTEETQSFADSLCKSCERPVEKTIGQARSGFKYYKLKHQDTLIVVPSSQCEGTELDGGLEVCSTVGKVVPAIVPVYSSDIEDVYFIRDIHVKELKQEGIILNRMTSIDGYISQMTTNRGWMLESTMRQYGYSVKAKGAPNMAQRQVILRYIIDKGIISAYGVIGFLEFLIDSHLGAEAAVNNWKKDIDFVRKEYVPKPSLVDQQLLLEMFGIIKEQQE